MGNYVNQADLEQYTGFASQDFRQACVTMTATQWATFATNLCNKITQVINRFCNVTTLETHTATEYHSGRDESKWEADKIELDKTFFLYEVCQTATTVKVEEDITTTSTFNWTTRTQRTSTATGDYNVFQHNDLTSVSFINNVPCSGRDNVRITYTAGYATGSAELDAINLIAIEIATSVLLRKKKIQEASTIRNVGVRDFSPMFELLEEKVTLSKAAQDELIPYRRILLLDDVYSPF